MLFQDFHFYHKIFLQISLNRYFYIKLQLLFWFCLHSFCDIAADLIYHFYIFHNIIRLQYHCTILLIFIFRNYMLYINVLQVFVIQYNSFHFIFYRVANYIHLYFYLIIYHLYTYITTLNRRFHSFQFLLSCTLYQIIYIS